MNSSTRSHVRGSSGSRMRPTVPEKSGEVSWSVGPIVSRRGRRSAPVRPAAASAASIPRQQSSVGASMLSSQPLQKHRDVHGGQHVTEVVLAPVLVPARASDQLAEEAARQARRVGHLGQRQVSRVEAQPVDVGAASLVARPKCRRPERERAALVQQRVDVAAHVARRDAAQRRVARRGGGPLRVAEVGLAGHADAPVAPRLARRPLDRVVAVVDLVAEGIPLALEAGTCRARLGRRTRSPGAPSSGRRPACRRRARGCRRACG